MVVKGTLFKIDYKKGLFSHEMIKCKKYFLFRPSVQKVLTSARWRLSITQAYQFSSDLAQTEYYLAKNTYALCAAYDI